MSTLKTNNIEHLDASTPSVQVSIGGGVVFPGISTFSGVVRGLVHCLEYSVGSGRRSCSFWEQLCSLSIHSYMMMAPFLLQQSGP